MTSILVTGGAGYVGSVSVAALLEAGHDVVVLDDLTTGHRAAVADGATLVVGDYGDRATIDRVLAEHRVEAILHCGARSLVGESIQDPGRYYRDNVSGGIALLDAARSAGVQRLVFSSTAAVYGIPGRRRSARTPRSGRSTRTARRSARSRGRSPGTARAYGLRSVSLRYFNVAGATQRHGEDHDPETHLIPAVLRSVETDQPAVLFGDDYPTPDGTCIRDYIHVEDLADAHLRALEATALDDPRTDEGAIACNLGNGGGFSVREVLAAVAAVVGHDIPVTVAPRRVGDPPVLVASADRVGSGPRLATDTTGPRRDGGIGLGLAARPPGRLRGLRSGRDALRDAVEHAVQAIAIVVHGEGQGVRLGVLGDVVATGCTDPGHGREGGTVADLLGQDADSLEPPFVVGLAGRGRRLGRLDRAARRTADIDRDEIDDGDHLAAGQARSVDDPQARVLDAHLVRPEDGAAVGHLEDPAVAVVEVPRALGDRDQAVAPVDGRGARPGRRGSLVVAARMAAACSP